VGCTVRRGMNWNKHIHVHYIKFKNTKILFFFFIFILIKVSLLYDLSTLSRTKHNLTVQHSFSQTYSAMLSSFSTS